ncbi:MULTISPECIES: aspartate aminotransferase family protein [unclassified Novosphingobium]|uniref:aspartate aminotransferase family protein n=1 Tax=unclassified Novosphingobium TaxID=2644732 RepID=UPI0003B6D4CC|nr:MULTISPECIES: aspartate aminotransferase family protein [unclassified Novosphingobium]KPF52538.1 acetylornithine aminotransferase [Novosphingobium sp. AAP1]MBB3359785.1 acetylornithine/N-succinyldiaminopimelate aminotransferase [Novosphingobium sp. BK256]MBB3376144.1 acetylornithine/N-succinyldiaminopimelate aminotransferase [Novosphingobium sp. BK280]MBB3380558.1 acetylornithine/N-succinyldiaminopimelate aminotransferase [Novosphingobium sp. BK258]MBB3422209.1 acetylornithine/N-succinyldia
MSITPLMPVYPRCGVRPVRGEHCHLISEDGTRYLDFASGIAVNLLGHSHPHLIGAIQRQAETLMHVSNLYGSPQGEALAQRLVDMTFAATVFFTNSGAEAVECAIKTARAYHQYHGQAPERFEIITYRNAFHGRTMGTISASDQEKMHKGFLPILPGFHYVDFNDLEATKALIGPHTAGILVEPIQGEGGIREGSEEFIKGLRALCDEHGLLLIFDEVQCGVARSGTMFAYEQYGVAPDVMAIAKGIGGGFPLGACLATETAARGMVFGTHGSTYGGNPLAMAAGNAVLDVVATPEFLAQVRATGDRLKARLEQFIGNYPDLFEMVRGKGLMLGVKCKVEPRPFVAHMRDNHQLLAVAAGDMTFRVLPPLVIDDSHIDEFMDKLSAAAASYVPPAPAA